MPKLLSLFLIVINLALFAQDSAAVRHFDAEEFEEFIADERYQYDKQPEVREPNAFLKGLGELLSFIGDFIVSKTGIFVLALLLIFGILFAFRSSIFKKKVKEKPVKEYIPNVVDTAGLSAQKIRKAIEQAEKDGDYRSAIRNLYLLVLLSLSNSKLLKLHIEKTNSDYRKELPKKYQTDFKRLTRIFDFVWYGDYPASEGLFAQAKAYATLLNQQKNVA